jgi:hypothetical protein
LTIATLGLLLLYVIRPMLLEVAIKTALLPAFKLTTELLNASVPGALATVTTSAGVV